jgi:hypothetical protein
VILIRVFTIVIIRYFDLLPPCRSTVMWYLALSDSNRLWAPRSAQSLFSLNKHAHAQPCLVNIVPKSTHFLWRNPRFNLAPTRLYIFLPSYSHMLCSTSCPGCPLFLQNLNDLILNFGCLSSTLVALPCSISIALPRRLRSPYLDKISSYQARFLQVHLSATTHVHFDTSSTCIHSTCLSIHHHRHCSSYHYHHHFISTLHWSLSPFSTFDSFPVVSLRGCVGVRDPDSGIYHCYY